MDNDLVLTRVSSYLSNWEIFQIFTQLSTLSRSLWRDLVAERSPSLCPDIFELFKSVPSRAVWIDNLLLYSLTNRVYEPTINGDTIVHKCARRGDVFSVYILLHVGVGEFDPNTPGSGGMTILHCAAACSGRAVKLCILLLRSCDPSLRDEIGRFPEDWANKQHSFEVSDLLRTRRLPPPSIGCFPFQFN